jgi:hypothetical protein
MVKLPPRDQIECNILEKDVCICHEVSCSTEWGA